MLKLGLFKFEAFEVEVVTWFVMLFSMQTFNLKCNRDAQRPRHWPWFLFIIYLLTFAKSNLFF